MIRRRQWHPTPVFLPGKPHGRRSLVGCSPWGREESDTTERLHFHFSLSCIGEGNGNPLHCSCLENPRDGGAWWAAVYGVAQSWTRLKWLSSSSSSRAVIPWDSTCFYPKTKRKIWIGNLCLWRLRVGHDWATSLSLFTFMHWRRKWQPTPVFLPGEPQGRGSLVGCRLWGHT